MPVIKESFDNWKGPLLLFFEGALTNGQGYLEIDSILLNDILEVNRSFLREIVLFALEYKRKDEFSPINTTNNQFFQLIKMLFNFKNDL